IGPEYDKLLEQIRDAPSRHMDTTPWRVNGENHDLWTFVTKSEAIFRITKSNNHEVPLTVLGDHKETDVHDRHSAFETLAKKTGNDQQYCWLHIICDAKELERFYGKEGRIVKESLQKIHEDAKAFNGHGIMEDVDRLHEKLT
ncbi:transposase (ISH10), partial [mine drainage metagenome]